jgi:hypothetical protein
MPYRNTTTTVNRQFVAANAARLIDLPEPGERYLIDAIPDDYSPLQLKNKGLIKTVKLESREYDGGIYTSDVRIWTTREDGWESIQNALDEDHDDALPCSGDAAHRGFSNGRGTDEYECTVCGERHPRTVVEASVGGGA